MKYEYWLASMKGVTSQKKIKLAEKFSSKKQLYNIEETGLKKIEFLTPRDADRLVKHRKEWDLDKEYNYLLREEISLVHYENEIYPKKLKEIVSPPYALYVKGNLPKNERFVVGIVGARQCTPYGRKMAFEISKELACNGIDVISGLAKGVDGAAGRGALDGGGNSYAVLGCGANVCYPREHIGLYMDIKEKGGIISEQIPDTPALPRNFPARNRIISGISDIVIIIEARMKSGSLITADMAMEQGKDVYALPGPITSELSSGCNALIKQGAGIFLSVEDFMEDIQMIYEQSKNILTKNKIKLESAENLVYSCLDLFPKSVEQVVQETFLPIEQVMDIIMSLELNGYIDEISRNYYIKKK